MTPRILAAAIETDSGENVGADKAVEKFVDAVSNAYKAAVIPQPDKLWVLSRPSTDGIPGSVALLALSVLAAYEMHGTVDIGPNAYYPRLASRLGCGLAAGLPVGFDPDDFADLWEMLASWLDATSGRSLALPGPNAGLRRFIAYPLCHVPLRQVDIEKLPEFFEWARLEPGSRSSPQELLEALNSWVSARPVLTKAGEAAVSDARCDAVGVQVALELEAWDGSSIDAGGSRRAPVHLLLDFVRRRPRLDFLARRPAAFPKLFNAGPRTLEAGYQGWYDPMPATPTDGAILRDGFAWRYSAPGGFFSLYRPPSVVIPLRATSEYTGYLSQRGLPLGLQSAVLCTEAAKESVEGFLCEASGVRCQPVNDSALPDGWTLFAGIVPIRCVPAPLGLDALDVQADASIVLRGGLRLGRRAAWLAGAPPTILIGGPPGTDAVVDGKQIPVHDGVVQVPYPPGVGAHVVEAGGSRRRFEVVEPESRWDQCPPLVSTIATPVALPPGLWRILGAAPGEITTAQSTGEGCLVAASFRPVWGVSVGAKRGAAVVALTDPPPPNVTVTRPRRASLALRSWVSAIYEAQIRRPRFGSISARGDRAHVAAGWAAYVRVAKQFKRQWRRSS